MNEGISEWILFSIPQKPASLTQRPWRAPWVPRKETVAHHQPCRYELYETQYITITYFLSYMIRIPRCAFSDLYETQHITISVDGMRHSGSTHMPVLVKSCTHLSVGSTEKALEVWPIKNPITNTENNWDIYWVIFLLFSFFPGEKIERNSLVDNKATP